MAVGARLILAEAELALGRDDMARGHIQDAGGLLTGYADSQLEIDYQGELAEKDVSLVTAAAVKGLLQRFTEDRINPVNARLVAASRGLKLVERRTPSAREGYPNGVVLRPNGAELAGTVLLGEPRVTRLGSFRVDLVPEGRFLVSRHEEERPGPLLDSIGLGQLDS